MTKTIIGISAIIILGYLAQTVLPWWSIAIVAALVGALLGKDGWKSFMLGFFAVLLLWSTYSFMINSANEGILSSRLGELLGGLSGTTMILVTGILGGLVGGFGAMTGALGRKLID